jgi:tRNA A-37 threonylcarbamoyl transferase component Bud32
MSLLIVVKYSLIELIVCSNTPHQVSIGSYGVYDVHGRDGVGLLLEKIGGSTLEETLSDVNTQQGIFKVFMDCWWALERFHEAAYAHRDTASNQPHYLHLGECGS